ncbi:MAG: amidohydrolase family protein [Blautia sp.]|nr:amidohydrolase family protein [Blautia sp.]
MYDYVITNGWIVNGKNEKPFYGTLAVKNGKIAEISADGSLQEGCPGERITDAGGGFVAPGFLDIHRHGDWEALRGGDDELLLRQGITTAVNGNCGLSVAPAGSTHQKEIEDFLSSVTGRGSGVNLKEAMASMSGYMKCLSGTDRYVNTGMLAGNGTIRAGVCGYGAGPLTKEELRRVWAALEESLEAGVLGISLGIAYAPEFEYTREELVQVLEPLRGTGIPIITHVRNEGDGLLESLDEVIYVAGKLSVPLHVSHLKCIGKKNWGETAEKVLKRFDRAQQQGVRVDFDLYPYLTGSTQLVHVLPPECQEGGTEMILRRLSDRDYCRHLTEVLKTPSREFENIVELAGFENIYASTMHTERFLPYVGQSVAAIAKKLGLDEYDTLYQILKEEKCQVTMLDTVISQEDMLLFLKDKRANLISDAIYPEGGKYHPRVYAAFPRFLVDYVRDKQVFSIEEAIYKMTGKPAQVLGIDRGVLEVGKTADICVFHLENLKVHADFENPDRLCEGMDYVFVAGEKVLDHDCLQDVKCGRTLIRRSCK